MRTKILLPTLLLFSVLAVIAPANASMIVNQPPLSSYSIIVGQSVRWWTSITISSDVPAAPYLLDDFGSDIHANWGDGSSRYSDIPYFNFPKPYPTTWTSPLVSIGHTYTTPGIYSVAFTVRSWPESCTAKNSTFGSKDCQYISKYNQTFAATVVVKPVPAPPSWSLLIAGLGVIGRLVARRKKQRQCGTPRVAS